MAKPTRTFTPSEIEQVKTLGAAGVSFAQVLRQLSAHRETLIAALDRQECGHFMETYFAPRQGYGGQAKKALIAEREEMPIRKLKPEQIKAPLVVPDNAQTRWLTKSWSKAA